MHHRPLRHLSDVALDRELSAIVQRENATTAQVVAHIAEFEVRRIYREKGYGSMFAYCTQALHLSEYQAYKRIRVARLSRRLPCVLDALTDGRVHLAALALLSRHLNAANAADLLAEATHCTKAEVEVLIARHFPRPDMPTRVTPIPSLELAPGRVRTMSSLEITTESEALPATTALERHVPDPPTPPRIVPLAPRRFALQVTVGQETHDKLRRAQELLGFSVSSGDVANVLDRALDALIEKLEKRRFGRTETRRTSTTSSGQDPRYIPNAVRRQVWARDGGQCTFMSESGHRCTERRALEFDHIIPVARGGGRTPSNLRLRCRAHNQLEAERVFGSDFMDGKRGRAGRAAG